MRLVMLSDTHTMHNQVKVPEGDILIHAGDFTYTGARYQWDDAIAWLESLPHPHKIFIAGNHDFNATKTLEKVNGPGFHYLEDSGCRIGDIDFWGSPYTPTFGRWAYMADRGADILKHWDLIPITTNILITHGPPWGILDVPGFSPPQPHCGCEDLHDSVFEIVRPQVHVFGHIHGGHGEAHKRLDVSMSDIADIDFFNASVVNEDYQVVNAPWVIDL